VETAVPVIKGIATMSSSTELSTPDTVTASTQMTNPGREVFLTCITPDSEYPPAFINVRPPTWAAYPMHMQPARGRCRDVAHGPCHPVERDFE
jgi:hypothetical protein